MSEMSNTTIPVQVTVRLRNAKMITARKEMGLSQKRLAAAACVSCATIQRLEKFDLTMPRDYMIYVATEIAEVLLLDVTDVIPATLRGYSLTHTFVEMEDVTPQRLLACTGTKFILPPPDIIAEGRDEIYKIRRLMNQCLSYREATVLNMRYGLGEVEGDTYGLLEIAKIFHVTRERVRQIAERAKDKLDVAVRLDKKCNYAMEQGRKAYGNMLENFEKRQT